MTTRNRSIILTLIIAGYVVSLIAVAGMGWLVTDSMRRLEAITEDLYAHQFTVSNAAAELKASLFELRNKMVQIILLRDFRDELLVLEDETAEYEQNIKANMLILKANFHEDLRFVNELEAKIKKWHAVRAKILEANRDGMTDVAKSLIKNDSTLIFNQIIPLAEYILVFTKIKAQDSAQKAHDSSRETVLKVFESVGWLMAIMVSTAVFILRRVHYLQAELDRQATTDFLTGIPNRRHFMEMVHREAKRTARYFTEFALAIVDLDRFKNINDTYGHEMGDEVLKKFCVVCQQTLRVSDAIGRIGGEEFAILFPNTRLADATDVLERVRVAVEQIEMATPQGQPLRITASFGLTTYMFEKNELDMLFTKADEALYRAKNSGRNRVCTA